jgi:hypothetical protein
MKCEKEFEKHLHYMQGNPGNEFDRMRNVWNDAIEARDAWWMEKMTERIKE